MRSRSFGIRLVAGAAICLGLSMRVSTLAGQAESCDGGTAVAVAVLDETGLVPIPVASVLVTWGGGNEEEDAAREAVGPDGRVVLCAPRDATRATLRAELGDASSEEVDIPIITGTSHDAELRLRFEATRPGRLIGRVRDAVTEKPVTAAAVSVAGSARVEETDRRGLFSLDDVPAGMTNIAVRHLGYAPLSYGVLVSPDVTTEIEIGLVPDPVEMEPLVATTTRSRRLEIKGFYERRQWGERLGAGIFLTAEDIDRWRPSEISSLIAFEAGVQRECSGGTRGCRLISRRVSRGFTRGGCAMTVWLDGFKVGSSVDELVRPVEVAAVEIYKGAASIPAEFTGFDSRCGVIAIWTK